MRGDCRGTVTDQLHGQLASRSLVLLVLQPLQSQSLWTMTCNPEPSSQALPCVTHSTLWMSTDEDTVLYLNVRKTISYEGFNHLKAYSLTKVSKIGRHGGAHL